MTEFLDVPGGPAVLVGHSISGGAATIAAATRPDLVAGIIEINPFTRSVHYSLGGLLRVRRYMTALAAKLREPGRMAEFLKTFKSTPADAEKQLPNVRCPALVIMGTLDPDFAGSQAEGDAIIAAMSAGAGTAAMAGGAGHYPHAQSPDAVAELVIPFLKEHTGA